MKPDYSDLYKFVVSLAIVLLSLAVLAPLFVLRESFNVQISASELAQLSPTARQLVEYRQAAALLLTRSAVWISSAAAVLGFALLLIGFNEWRKRQEKADQQHDYEVEKLRREVVGSMTPTEIAKKALEELGLDSIQADQPDNPDSTHPSYILAKYLRIKELFADRLAEALDSDSGYLIRRDEIIGDSKYALIMQGKDPQTPDVIIEIRYSASSASQAWIKGETGRTALALQSYRRLNRRRDVYASVIFVVPMRLLLADRQDQYANSLSDDLLDPKVRVHFTAEEDLGSLKAETVTSFLPEDITHRIAENRRRIQKQDSSKKRKWALSLEHLPLAVKIAAGIVMLGLWTAGLYAAVRVLRPQWVAHQRNAMMIIVIGTFVFLIIVVAVMLLRRFPQVQLSLIFEDGNGRILYAKHFRHRGSTIRLRKRWLQKQRADLRAALIESGIFSIVIRLPRDFDHNREALIMLYDETGTLTRSYKFGPGRLLRVGWHLSIELR